MHGCRPRPCPPPNPVKGIEQCWDSSEALYNLVQQVLLDVLATNPEVLPQPPGVIDGSAAKPGYPGEIWTSTFTGPYSGANLTPPQVNFAVFPDVLPPGDWDLQVQLQVNYAGAGSPQACVMWFSPAMPGMINDGVTYAPNIPQATSPYPPAGMAGQPLCLASPVMSVNISQQRGVVMNFAVWGTLSYPSGTVTAYAFARRVR